MQDTLLISTKHQVYKLCVWVPNSEFVPVSFFLIKHEKWNIKLPQIKVLGKFWAGNERIESIFDIDFSSFTIALFNFYANIF